MSTPTMDDAAKVLADPTAYADDARLHAALTHLRAHNPVAWVDNPPYRPFWAITKHADILAIEPASHLRIGLLHRNAPLTPAGAAFAAAAATHAQQPAPSPDQALADTFLTQVSG